MEAGVAGNLQRIFIRPGNRDAGVPKGLKGEIQIGTAFHRGQEPDPAVSGKQRQREEQAGDKLAGNASGNRIFPGSQAALHPETAFGVFQQQPLIPAEILIDRKGPGQQGFAAFQAHGLSGEQAQGNHETQGAPGFPAAQDCGSGFPGIAAPDADGVSFPGEGSTEGCQAFRCGEDILAWIHAAHQAFPFRKGGTDQQAVRHGLGRRRRHGTPGSTGLDHNIH